MKLISNKFRYILIVAFAILLIFELITLNYNQFWHWQNFLKPIIPILMIIAMIASIKHVNKHGEN
ncbi:hypothetical protein J1D01_13565 [Seonamhaeicola sp. NFXS20]|uniref:hypothetical protein n=1 Tax=unclassified Seonamhaeicola TaxID=2622645 RepID=UPI003564155D